MSFDHWMRGQTMGVCEGKQWHHIQRHTGLCPTDQACTPTVLSVMMVADKETCLKHCNHAIESDEYDWQCDYTGEGYEERTKCFGNPHGVVAYRRDVERYLHGWPIID